MKRSHIWILFLLVEVNSCFSFNFEPPRISFDYEDFAYKFTTSDFKGEIEEFVSEKCLGDLTTFVERLLNPIGSLEPGSGGRWPLKMWDAMGKYPTDGFFTQGNFISPGSPSSCVEVEAIFDTASSKGQFAGKYCYVTMLSVNQSSSTMPILDDVLRERHTRGLNLISPSGAAFLNVPEARALLGGGLGKFGICLPDSCSFPDIENLLGLYSLTLSSLDELFIMSPQNCIENQSDKAFETGDILFLIIISIFLALVALGTLYDWIHRWQKDTSLAPTDNWIVGFSLQYNCSKLFRVTEASRGEDHLSCLDGIRFLSMSWVLLSHAYSSCLGLPLKNMFHVGDEFVEPFLFRTILNGYVCVDSFFVLSGVLTAYLTFKELDRNEGWMNVPLFYIHRYIRLTGVYAMMIFFSATVYKYLDIGPLNNVEFEVQMCKDVWYSNLLYYNIFVFEQGFCLGHTWFLTNDFYFFLLSPLLTIPMWWITKKSKRIWALVYPLIWLAIFTIIIAVLAYAKDWPLSSLVDFMDYDYQSESYIKPWCRCQPYILGLMVGYLVHTTKKQNLRISWPLSYWLWIASTGIALSIIWGVNVHEVWQTGVTPTLVASVFFNAFSRIGWALALGWLIFACCRGQAGSFWINSFLTWEGFVPLSRLTYCIFLCHCTVIPVMLSFFTHHIYVTHFFVTLIILAAFTISLMVAIFMCLVIEM
eukprot:TCALIF_07497-PA protein Name:"Similar to nrf-6 Nose resistant to fluoxetine protein 6 (Caenorhabditis elegans)" AED:0.02 eAED:0.02 QI:34/1/0.75/1/0.63/0.66/12/0/701